MDKKQILASSYRVLNFDKEFKALVKTQGLSPFELCLFFNTGYESVARRYPEEMEWAEREVRAALKLSGENTGPLQ
jgi:hypothetical protein